MFGYRPSPKSAVGTHDVYDLLRRRLGFDESVAAADNSDLIVNVIDQWPEASCVANAGAQCFRGEIVRARADALVSSGAAASLAEAVAIVVSSPPPLPSRNFLYWVGRNVSGWLGEDAGTSPSDALAAWHAVGVPTEDAYPYGPDTLHQRPPWAVFRQAADQRWLDGYARINSTGSRLIAELETALAARALIWTGSRVDQAFCDLLPGEVWAGPVGSVLGGHSYVLYGFDRSRRAFSFVNSWGTAYGGGGFGWLSYDAADALQDNWAMKSAPTWAGTR